MDFALSEEQQLIYDTAYGFGQESIAPYAYEWEKAGTMPREVFLAAAELGFGALYVPEEQGGSGLSRL
ncbi:MAG: acyl-CoA dehydrogenase family protein, partial [Geminicoccaceae bacterium]